MCLAQNEGGAEQEASICCKVSGSDFVTLQMVTHGGQSTINLHIASLSYMRTWEIMGMSTELSSGGFKQRAKQTFVVEALRCFVENK